MDPEEQVAFPVINNPRDPKEVHRPKPFSPNTPYSEDYNKMLNTPKKKLLQNHSPEEIRHLEMLMGGPQNLVLHYNLTPTEYQMAIGNLVPRPPPHPVAFLHPVPVTEPIRVRQPVLSRTTMSKPVRFVGPAPALLHQDYPKQSQYRPPHQRVAAMVPNYREEPQKIYHSPKNQNYQNPGKFSGYVSPLNLSRISPLRNDNSRFSPAPVYRPPAQNPHYPAQNYQSPNKNYHSNNPINHQNPLNYPHNGKSILKNAIPDVLSGNKNRRFQNPSPDRKVKFSPFRKVADGYGGNHVQRQVPDYNGRRMDLDTIDGVGARRINGGGGGGYGSGYYG